MRRERLSHYRILGELSRGGMGVIYRALDEKLDREVALKVLPPEVVADPDRKKRFEREARAAASLEHPHIGVVYGFDEDDGVSFIAMELIRGPKLEEVIAFETLPLQRVLDIAIEMAEGLSSAHQKGVVHRDFKPANVMMTAEGHIKIIDFGLAKLLEEPVSTSEGQTEERLHTEPGKVMGTVDYMSPEQAKNRELDHRTDVFSFGIVLHELLSGARPFAGASAFETVGAILKDTAPRLKLEGRAPRLVAELQRVLDKCLAKLPEDRYQSMSDVAVDLRQVRRLFDATASHVAVDWREKRRPMWVAPAVAILAAAVLYTLVARERFPPAVPEDVRPPSSSRQASVAVLGFKNLTGDPETAWLSTAFSEMLGTELATGAVLRVISGEEVARARIELSLGDVDAFSDETLAQIQANLGADFVIVGSYATLGGPERQIRLDAKLQDVARGYTVAAIAETSTHAGLFRLVERAGASLRESLGVRALSSEEAEQVHAAYSSSLRATRLYSEALSELRNYRAMEARLLFEQAVDADPGFAQAHTGLSRAWSALGFEARAAESARRAYELAEGLPREEFLVIEARSYETSGAWDEAVRTYETLWNYHPDNIDHGLRLAGAEIAAGKPSDALKTLAEIRSRYAEAEEDPRVDLAEAEAAAASSEYEDHLEAIERVVEGASRHEAWLLLAEARYSQGRVLIRAGKPARARQSIEEARRLFEQGANRGRVADCMNQLAILLKYEGRLDEAEEMYREALAIHREYGNRLAASSVLNNLAFAIWQRGELSAAESLLDEGLAMAREVGSLANEANTLDTLASVYFSQGRLTEARRASEQALELADRIQEESMAAWMHYTLGLIDHAEGSASGAARRYEEALALCEKIGYRHLSGYVLNDQGRLLMDRGELAASRDKLDASLRVRTELGETGTAAETKLNLALLELARARSGEAARLAGEVASEFSRERMPDYEVLAHAVRALALLSEGKGSEARDALLPAVERARASESPPSRLSVAIVDARVRAADGDRGALGALERVRDECGRRGLGRLELDARLGLGEAKLGLGDAASGRTILTKLAEDARRRGFDGIARKAEAALH